MFKHLKIAVVGFVVAMSFTAAADRGVPAAPVTVEAEGLANLKYPGDCDSKTLRKEAEKGGCTVEAGGEHWKVYKSGSLVTTIPHTVKENNTCRSIIKEINDNC
jgi:hypothetical protein